MSRMNELAAALVAARRDARLLDAADWAGALATSDEAYAVQRLVTRALDGDAPAIAWKSGGPSRDAVLTHAPLPRAHVVPAWGDGACAIEAEVALRLARDVTAADAQAMTPESAGHWVDAMAPTIELVGTRFLQGVQIDALLKLADQQAHVGLVVGAFVPWRRIDWAAQRCEVRIGSEVHRFTGSYALGDPAWLLPAWLRHATQGGARVPAGTIVTTGTWCGLLEVPEGIPARIAFDGIGELALRG